jgi:hypothetical protein
LLLDQNGNKIVPVLNNASLTLLDKFNSIYNKLLHHFITAMDLDLIPEIELKLGQTAYVLTPEDKFSPSFVLNILPSAPSSTPGAYFPTKMTLSIIFNCDQFNLKHTLASINDKWTQMIEGLVASEIIKTNFVFFSGEPLGDNNLEETVDTLPPYEEPEEPEEPEKPEPQENNAVSFGAGLFFSLVLFIAFF